MFFVGLGLQWEIRTIISGTNYSKWKGIAVGTRPR